MLTCRIQTVQCAIRQTQGVVRHVRRDISRCLCDRLQIDRKVSTLLHNYSTLVAVEIFDTAEFFDVLIFTVCMHIHTILLWVTVCTGLTQNAGLSRGESFPIICSDSVLSILYTLWRCAVVSNEVFNLAWWLFACVNVLCRRWCCREPSASNPCWKWSWFGPIFSGVSRNCDYRKMP